MPDVSPDILRAVGSGIAGLIGALIGAWAAKTRHRNEYNFRLRNAYRVVALELLRNQQLLFRDLDRVLLAWIARIHVTGTSGIEEVRELLSQAHLYDTLAFDALLTDLLASTYGSELLTYYQRLKWLNERMSSDLPFDVAHDFSSYVLKLSNSILAADDLIPELYRASSKSGMKPWGKNQDFDEFSLSRDTFVVTAHAAKYDLKTLEAFVQTGQQPRYFPDVLARNRERLSNYVDAAKKV